MLMPYRAKMFLKDSIVTSTIVIIAIVAYGVYTHMSIESILIFALIALFTEIGIDFLLKSIQELNRDKD